MEIGGYLEYEQYHGKAYHKECLKLNTARNCLKYLIEARNIRKLWISRWNCSAVLDTCRACGVSMFFFDLDDNLFPILPENYQSEDCVYVVNYYGLLSGVHFENMILDNSQAFFQMPLSGIDTIYTCRKFFGVTDGAYLYTDSRLDRKLERDSSYSRIGYIAGRYEKSGSEFFSLYRENEEKLDNLPLMQMSLFTENMMNSIDYGYVKNKREENYQYLSDRLSKINLLKTSNPSGPFAYPLLVNNGQCLREKLQSEKIYIAKLWPNVTEGREGKLAENILPLPCDQRYGLKEMEFISKKIIDFLA